MKKELVFISLLLSVIISLPADLQQITTNPANDWDPHWSPDGNYFCFTSDRSGNNDIWVKDFELNSTDNIILKANVNLSNYPNPFNPSTTISFSLTAKNAKIEIYNLKGQEVKTLDCHPEFIEGLVYEDNTPRPSTGLRMTRAGRNQYLITWNGTDNNDQPVSSGIYYCIIKQRGKILASKKMILMK